MFNIKDIFIKNNPKSSSETVSKINWNKNEKDSTLLESMSFSDEKKNFILNLTSNSAKHDKENKILKNVKHNNDKTNCSNVDNNNNNNKSICDSIKSTRLDLKEMLDYSEPKVYKQPSKTS